MSEDSAMRNYGNVCLVMGIAGVIGAALPFLVNIEIDKGGGALIFGGGVIALTGFFSALHFFKVQGRVDRILKPANVLARWEGVDEDGDPFQVTFSREGVIYNGNIYSFFEPGHGLREITLDSRRTPPAFLRLVISYRKKGGLQKADLRIPIPGGEQQNAQGIRDALGTVIKKEA